MAKSNLKTLLVAFSTTREVDGEDKRVRFKSGSTVDLTAEELAQLERLQQSSGKLHFRDPINERAQADEPEAVDEGAYAGENIPMDKKTGPQLKAFLSHHGVEFAGNASKADLLSAAEAKQKELDDGDNGL